MAQYLDFDGFKGLATIPASFVEEVDAVAPKWVQGQLDYWARWIDSRLRKRYCAPFPAFDAVPDPTPPAVQGWLARIVTVKVMLKRGVDPNDVQFELLREDYERALAEISEAANGEDGLFDLPIRTAEDPTAIAKGSPRFYSEQSPYVGNDVQAAAGRLEDQSGRGSGTG